MTSGAYRTADGRAQITWELKDGDCGPVFSATGDYDGESGQNLDSIGAAYPGDSTIQAIVAVWRHYHLNGMCAGTVEQESFLKELRAKRKGTHDYDSSCKALKKAGLYEVPITPGMTALGGFPPGATTYTYGSGWLYKPIPDDILAQIRSWADLPARNPMHEDKATEFLTRNGLKFRAVFHGDRCPTWCDGKCCHGDRYCVTISRKGGGRLRRRVTIAFDFWNAYTDVRAGKPPTAYSVLATCASEISCPEDFAEFCIEFGESNDSRRAETLFRRCDKFARRLRAFFTPEERNQLAKIS